MATKSIGWGSASGGGNIVLTYTGQGNGSISVTSDPNPLGTARSKTLSLHTVDGVIAKNITVRQVACPFPIGEVRNYSYTGSYQTVELPAGQYKFQVWGAQGGADGYGYTNGGKGGYSEGVITLASKTTVRVYVGGQGTSSSGGYNGGGSTSYHASYDSGGTYGYSYMGGGGGATDIRLSDGALLSRMIVAGGGSGGAYTYREWQTSETETTTPSYDFYGLVLYTGDLFLDNDTYKWNFYAVPSEYIGGTASVRLIEYNSTDFEGVKPSLSAMKITLSDHEVSGWGTANGYWESLTGTEFTSSNQTKSISIPSGTTHIIVMMRYGSNDPTYENVWSDITLSRTVSSTDSSHDYTSGYAGGGTNGAGYSSSYYGKQNGAGSGGSFGQGANQSTTNYRHCSGAGGGGWYGGGYSYSDGDMSAIYYMGGGSGWVNIAANASYRPSGYTGLELGGGKTIAGNSSFPSTSGSTEYGHSGNGYARITRLDPKYAVPLTFKALDAGTIGWKCSNSSYARTIEYSKNGGSWTSLTSTTSGVTISVAAGDEVQFRGANTYYGYSSYYNCFTATCRFKAYGNIMSLFYKTGFIGETVFTSNYALQYLFYNNTKLIDASGLMLPATTLTAYCYQYMFYGCSAMTAGPETLPATTLQSYCYQYMFYGCTSLVKAPTLPAQTLTTYCYNYMFQNCSSLNYVNAAFTTTPSTSYTSSWLSGVAATGTFIKGSLATWTTTGVSAIPSGWTVEYNHDEVGYMTIESLSNSNVIKWYMVSGMSSRTIYWAKDNTTWNSVAPSTSGTTITTLNEGEKLYIRGDNSYYASSTSYYCYFGSSADYKVYGNIMSLRSSSSFDSLTSISSNYAFAYLFRGSIYLKDASGLKLPATSLTSYCYYGMFYGCTAMTAAPENLPATTLQSYCYSYMFYNCTNLVSAPLLPAVSLTSYCYNYMFYGCSRLNYIKALFTTSPSNSYTQNWVSGVAATGTFVKHTNATWTTTGTNACPSGWTVERASS